MIRLFTSQKQKIGKRGEDAAIAYLYGQGFRIIDRNVSNRYGEIDIIADRRGVTFFFEVKTGRFGGVVDPAENLSRAKIKRFLRSVAQYRMENTIRSYRVQGVLVLQKATDEYTVETIDFW